MANTQSITLVPGAWTALPNVTAFTFTNSTHGDTYVRVAAAPPAIDGSAREGSHILLDGESMNRISLGVHYVYSNIAKVCAFTEDDS